jgi:hypothetical protein
VNGLSRILQRHSQPREATKADGFCISACPFFNDKMMGMPVMAEQ